MYIYILDFVFFCYFKKDSKINDRKLICLFIQYLSIFYIRKIRLSGNVERKRTHVLK